MELIKALPEIFEDFAERDLPRNLCPMVKASYGFAVSDKCPFFYFSDVVVGETILKLWTEEILKFKAYLEKTFGAEITEENVRKAVHMMNENRAALKNLYEVMKNDPAPMNGQELFNVLYGSQFRFDKEKVPEEINALRKKIMKEYEEGGKQPKKKRILLTGCPSSGAPMKVVKALEENGAVVVAYENCGGKEY